jgi:hypothetical protein
MPDHRHCEINLKIVMGFVQAYTKGDMPEVVIAKERALRDIIPDAPAGTEAISVPTGDASRIPAG